MPDSPEVAGGLTPRHATRILSSLEAGPIRHAFHLVCVELLGPCEVDVYTFLEGESSRVIPFGVDEERAALDAPDLGPAGAEGMLTKNPDGRDLWRALLQGASPFEGPVGIVEAAFERPLVPGKVALLNELAHALTQAVRNARTFEKTRQLTFTDDLTALYNSRFMALYLDRELKRCRRSQSHLSLLFMDLDGFKAVNDTHGHLAGSRTLVEVGAVLERTVRDADVLIRYGGDEFVILFPETPLSGGLIIAERVREVIAATRFLESENLEARVSASIGLAAYPETAEDVRGLISCADQAMYRAKTLGKNRVVVGSPVAAPQNLSKEA